MDTVVIFKRSIRDQNNALLPPGRFLLQQQDKKQGLLCLSRIPDGVELRVTTEYLTRLLNREEADLTQRRQ